MSEENASKAKQAAKKSTLFEYLLVPVVIAIVGIVVYLYAFAPASSSTHPIHFRTHAATFVIQGDYEQAAREFQKQYAQNPNVTNAFGLALSLIHLQRFDEAEKAIDHALKLDPNVGDSYLIKGVICSRRNQNEKAKEFLLEALRLNPRLDYAWVDLGIVHTNLKQFPEAIEAFNRALKISSQNAEAYLRLALLEAETSHWKEAWNDYQRYLDQVEHKNKAHIQTLRDLAAKFVSRKDYDKALEILTHCLTLDDDDKRVHFEMSEIYKELNNVELHKKHWTVANTITRHKSASV